MPAPPAREGLSDDFPNPSNALMRVSMGELYDFLIFLLGDTGEAADARAALGLGTTDTPQFTGLNLGHATDLTLTRDAAGELAIEGSRAYKRNNILAAVAESGGVPTGGIIERGSNANGEYVRYADGTQICWNNAVASNTAATAIGPLWGNLAPVTWTYPAAFIAEPVVSGGSGGSAAGIRWVVPGTVGTSNALLRVLTTATSGTSLPFGAMAVGRWF